MHGKMERDIKMVQIANNNKRITTRVSLLNIALHSIEYFWIWVQKMVADILQYAIGYTKKLQDRQCLFCCFSMESKCKQRAETDRIIITKKSKNKGKKNIEQNRNMAFYLYWLITRFSYINGSWNCALVKLVCVYQTFSCNLLCTSKANRKR